MKISLRLFVVFVFGALMLRYGLVAAMSRADSAALLVAPVMAPMLATVTLIPTAPGEPLTNTLYLPAVAHQVTPTPAPLFLPLIAQAAPTRTPQWERISRPVTTAPRDVAALALIDGGKLFVGDQRAGNVGGVYTAQLTMPCTPQQDFAQSQGALEVLSISVVGQQGLLGAYGKRVYYTTNGGDTWLPTATTTMNSFVFAVLWLDGVGYSGADDGLYVSDTGGQAWRKLIDGPSLVNVLRANAGDLWIGSARQGVWLRQGEQLLTKQRNLPTVSVWDIAFHQGQIFLATAAGLYRGDGDSDWQMAGLAGQELYSLAIGDGFLFVGVRNGGVQQASLTTGIPTAWQPLVTGADWQPTYSVRALLYDTGHCHGLWAATNDGVWLYHQPSTTVTTLVTGQSVQTIQSSRVIPKEQDNDHTTEQTAPASALRRKR